MRLAPLSLLALIACSEPTDRIRFIEPDVVVVVAGDTVKDLARRHAVPIDELIAWNGLAADTKLKEGQLLLVWRLDGDPSLASLEPSSGTTTARPTAAPRARKRSAPVMVVETEVLSRAPEPTQPGLKVNVDAPSFVRTRDAGVLGAIDQTEMGNGVDGLADNIGTVRGDGPTPGSSMGTSRSGSLGGGGYAENMDHVADTRVLGRTQGSGSGGMGSNPIRMPRLAMPAPKQCKALPNASQLTADEGMLTGKGLSAQQIRLAMSGFVRNTMGCIPSDTRGSFSLTTEITVGCDGRVSDVDITNTGGLPDAVTACVAHTLRYASFPAHDLPDGVTFAYPMQYRF